jgi:pterin-4a-carbinolamine dehydratase
MADTILTESEASLAVEDLGWRYLLDCLTTAVTVGSLFDACEVIRAAVDIAGPHANDYLRLRATADRVELTLETRGKFRVTTQDVDLARSITKAAHGRLPDGRAPGSSFGSVACNRDRCDGHPRSAPVLEDGTRV